MKYKIINATLVLAGIFAVGAFLHSCKKTDVKNLTENDEALIAKATKNIEKEIQEWGGIPQVVSVNERIPMTFVDLQGNPVDLSNNAALRSVCGGDLPDYCDLFQYVRVFVCSTSAINGYRFQFEYRLSWNNNVVKNNGTSYTRGRVRITHPSLGTVYDKTTTDATIKDLGADPMNTSNNIFSVVFTVHDLALKDYINLSGYTVRLGATFVSNCTSLENYGLAPADPSGWGFTPGLGTDPCNRNDKCWFQQPGALGTRVIGMAGSNVPGYSCYTVSSPAPSLMEVQYSLDGGVIWKQDFNNYTSGLGMNTIAGTRFIRKGDYAKSPVLTPGTYNLIVRYKNWNYNSTSSQWVVPTTSIACRTYGNDNANSWAYEFYPGTVIN